jgi:hypothetical protein
MTRAEAPWAQVLVYNFPKDGLGSDDKNNAAVC